VDLSSQDLFGSISPDIGQLTYLKVLNVSFNKHLSGVIPASIGQILGLEKLYLGQTNLTGKLPGSFGQLHELKEFDISGVSIGTFPTPLLQLHKLRMLSLYDCNITDILPSFSNMTNLIHLDLYGNKLFGSIRSSLDNQKMLKYLDLSFNQLSGYIPFSLGNLSSLTDLYLSNNHFSGGITSSLGNCSHMEVLRLATNILQGEIPDIFGTMPNLVKFLIDNNKFSGNFPKSLENCNKLEWFVTGNNSFTGYFPSVNSTHMEVFCVRDNRLTGPVPHWSFAPRLRVLDLGGNNFSGDIPGWIWNCPLLQVIDLYNNEFEGLLPNNFDSLLAFTHPISSSNESISSYELVLHIKRGNYRYKYLLQDITLLDLLGNKLKGNVPQNIGKLKGLKYLRLSNNLLNGSIPNDIGSIFDLEELDLSYNSFEGNIPKSFEFLTKLAIFNVSFNNLSGQIPTSGQFMTFDPFAYIGNAELCGKPLYTNCT
ncbi:hypothetical protein SELMODRAFT_20928, partial [Selaginella moellendorffii]